MYLCTNKLQTTKWRKLTASRFFFLPLLSQRMSSSPVQSEVLSGGASEPNHHGYTPRSIGCARACGSTRLELVSSQRRPPSFAYLDLITGRTQVDHGNKYWYWVSVRRPIIRYYILIRYPCISHVNTGRGVRVHQQSAPERVCGETISISSSLSVSRADLYLCVFKVFWQRSQHVSSHCASEEEFRRALLSSLTWAHGGKRKKYSALIYIDVNLKSFWQCSESTRWKPSSEDRRRCLPLPSEIESFGL